MKKICFVTSARSEYGLLKWLMKDVDDSKEFELQLIVTGGHLSYEQGHTVDQIIEDGFKIAYTVDAELDTSTTARIAESMGRMGQGFSKAFEELEPGFLVVLGDRYELLPICSSALVMGIPIVHIGGGDITEGAIDDEIRNAVTMMASYHFPGTLESANNIIRMRNSEKNVWTVGELGLDSFYRENLLSREWLAEDLKLDINAIWVLMTYHAETKESILYNLQNVKACIDELVKLDNVQTVITYSNADYGGKAINDYIEKRAACDHEKIRVIPSLGHSRYLSFMKQVDFIIGNSSSGIVESPFLNIPVINIGNRQKGRYQCGNVLQCMPRQEEISKMIKCTLYHKKAHPDDLDYWGDGHSSERIVKIFKENIL